METQPVLSRWETPKSAVPPAFAHQAHTTQFILDKKAVLIFSDPGTGKTRAVLDALAELKARGIGPALVLAPKAILEPAWLHDAQRFTPGLRVSVAYARNRLAAFTARADVYVTNHDAVTWLAANEALLAGFKILVVDESTAYKNRSSQRSRVLRRLVPRFEYRIAMTGTPMPNGVLDIWHQVLLVDDGERLGKSFYAFRGVVCEPVQTGLNPNFIDWRDREGATDAVADLLSDITVRYRFEDCVDIPENTVNTLTFSLPDNLRAQYDRMVRDALLALDAGDVQAVNAAAKVAKLLQICSGAVYGEDGQYHVLDATRYELITTLCEERQHTVVAFLWRHQRDQLYRYLTDAKLSVAVIDGETDSRDLPRTIQRFQDGEYRVLLAHPQSASHGLTLTRATTTIWSSPTYDAERYEQFNRRIYRAGQQRKTETLLIQAADTLEEQVYARLQNKLSKQLDLLGLLQSLSSIKKEAV